ncbi:Uncharacterised protein [Mycobacterium tuberculosis]|uniref:Uncharacterized protein n=1 Tax=Mycobacterium tuberculosis TaxID=1773 RepID=A0A655CGQ1_MYCTX|nr:Uncharacterised protein [Mycobacterium tuberculosis]CNU13147.1 Uncharacterised protein [Mycobacterium tuberculosis]
MAAPQIGPDQPPTVQRRARQQIEQPQQQVDSSQPPSNADHDGRGPHAGERDGQRTECRRQRQAGSRTRERDPESGFGRLCLAAKRGHPAEQPQRHALNGYPGATSDDGVRELMSQQRRQQHDRATCAEKPIDHGRVASDGTRQHGRQTPGEQPQDHQHAPVDVHHKPGDPPKRDRITHWVPPMLADKAFRAGG